MIQKTMLPQQVDMWCHGMYLQSCLVCMHQPVQYHYTLYSARMSPENTHKLMGFYMESLIPGINTMYMLFCFFKLFPNLPVSFLNHYLETALEQNECAQLMTGLNIQHSLSWITSKL